MLFWITSLVMLLGRTVRFSTQSEPISFSVFISLAWTTITTHHRMGFSNVNLYLTVAEAGKPKVQVLLIWFLVSAGFLAGGRLHHHCLHMAGHLSPSFLVLGMEPIVSHMVYTHSTTELHPQSFFFASCKTTNPLVKAPPS